MWKERLTVRSQISQIRNLQTWFHPFLSEVTQTPCSNSRPCPDGGPCLEYGGTYLCTCQTSAAELDHKDFYPYGKSLRHLPNNRACCSYVNAWAAGYCSDEHIGPGICHFLPKYEWWQLLLIFRMWGDSSFHFKMIYVFVECSCNICI